MFVSVAAVCGVLALTGPGLTSRAQIQGDYLEARTADIYTGPCFSNAEVFITGNRAVVAWKINRGSFDGVDLGGLCVAAAIKGNTTFGEDQPEQSRCIVIVDRQANAAQRKALVALAQHLGGERLAHVSAVRTALLSMMVEDHVPGEATHSPSKVHPMPHAPVAAFSAVGLAEIRTRPLDDGDHACGNEVVTYEPLSRGVHVLPAYTLGHRFKGQGLDTTWDDPNCRSSFVGHFSY